MYVKRSNAGFTMMEMMVVLVIVGLLLSIVLASISASRANARDKQRYADIETYALALQVYQEKYGYLPDCLNGLFFNKSGIIGSGNQCADLSTVQSFMNEFFGSYPVDPSDDGSGSPTYTYAYDSAHNACDSVVKPPILVVMEMEGNVKVDPSSICSSLGSDLGLNAASNPYVIRLDQTF